MVKAQDPLLGGNVTDQQLMSTAAGYSVLAEVPNE